MHGKWRWPGYGWTQPTSFSCGCCHWLPHVCVWWPLWSQTVFNSTPKLCDLASFVTNEGADNQVWMIKVLQIFCKYCLTDKYIHTRKCCSFEVLVWLIQAWRFLDVGYWWVTALRTHIHSHCHDHTTGMHVSCYPCQRLV
jgi:hypothetical protein